MRYTGKYRHDAAKQDKVKKPVFHSNVLYVQI